MNNKLQFPLVIVYQVGRVGSNSITHSMRRQYQGAVLHTHRLRNKKKWLYAMRALIRCRFSLFLRETMVNFFCLYRSYHAAAWIDGRIKLISLVREPIGRNVSHFFQACGLRWRELWQRTRRELKNGAVDMDILMPELKSTFLEKYPHEEKLAWFDNEMDKYFGIDVYSKPFPEVGYTYFKNDNGAELLLMRHDLDDKLKEKLIGDYVGIKDFRLTNRNIGADKEYARIYAEFKRRVKLPRWYIEKMCASKYFTHFYGREEIERVRSKWMETRSATERIQ